MLRVLRRTTIAVCAIAVVAAVAGGAAASAEATPAAPATAAATTAPRVSPAIPSWITRPVVNLARTWLTRAFARTKPTRVARRLATRTVDHWIDSGARNCPEPLPDQWFCNRGRLARWGVGMALMIDGRLTPVSPSPTRPTVVGSLLPGSLYWLTCWTLGQDVDSGLMRSNLWYRLTNGGWVSDAWLDTGTNEPIAGVERC